MSGKTGQGTFYTVGRVSTPAPQHLSANSSTTNAPATYSATFTTTPLQHLDYTLASMSSGYTLPPLSYGSEAHAPDTHTSTTAYPSSSSSATTTCPSPTTASPSSATRGMACASPNNASSTATNSLSGSSTSSIPAFPRYGISTTLTGRPASTRPGLVTSISRSNIITTRAPALTAHNPTLTTYATYNPAINKFTTHTPTTTTAFIRYRPNTSTFTARPPPTSTLTSTTSTFTARPPPTSAFTARPPPTSTFIARPPPSTISSLTSTAPVSHVYTLSPPLTRERDGSPPPEGRGDHPPPPKVTLASAATAHRPAPTWPLRVNLSSSEGYDNLDLDLGEEAGPPKGQVRTHMTKEQFLAVPQPDLELLDAGGTALRGWQSAQERLDERRRGGVWSLSLYPTSSTTAFTTTTASTTTAFTTSFTSSSTSSAATTEGTANLGNSVTATTAAAAYCNQVGHPCLTLTSRLPYWHLQGHVSGCYYTVVPVTIR
ncbi:uncharacterized protein [Panulirus ornatus]|uniref:uncharacterized protein n=1 Tax=Panulirus ornatus TaxID=150431 RepID=UPI003A84C130